MTWIDIAFRPRSGKNLLLWEKLPDSPHSVTEAKQMVNDGIGIIAHRHEPDRVVMCFKPRKRKSSQTGYFW